MAQGPSKLSEIMTGIQQWAGKNPRAVNSLLAGLGSAAVTGGLTAMSKREDETPAERRKRILRNALLGSVAGAGAYGLGDYAYGQFATADPGPSDPVLTPLRNILTLGGATGGVLTARGLEAMNEIRNRQQLAGDIVSNLTAKTRLTQTQKGLLDRAQKIADSKKLKFSQIIGLDDAFDEMMENSAIRSGLQGIQPKDIAKANYVAPFAWKAKDLGRFVGERGMRAIRRTFGNTLGRGVRNAGIIGTATALPYAAVELLNRNPELARNTFGGLERGNFEGIIPKE